jgi:hypothetical protein
MAGLFSHVAAGEASSNGTQNTSVAFCWGSSIVLWLGCIILRLPVCTSVRSYFSTLGAVTYAFWVKFESYVCGS